MNTEYRVVLQGIHVPFICPYLEQIMMGQILILLRGHILLDVLDHLRVVVKRGLEPDLLEEILDLTT